MFSQEAPDRPNCLTNVGSTRIKENQGVHSTRCDPEHDAARNAMQQKVKEGQERGASNHYHTNEDGTRIG